MMDGSATSVAAMSSERMLTYNGATESPNITVWNTILQNQSLTDQANVTHPIFHPGRPHFKPTSLFLFAMELEKTGMPIALAIGITGNIFIIITFLTTPLTKHPLSNYFAAIGISDLTFLVSSMIVWGSLQGFNIYNKIGFCQLTTYALFLSSFLAVWYIVSAHMERCMWHFSSRRRKKWCTAFRSKCIIILIAVFSMVAYLYCLWTYIAIHQCMPVPESMSHLAKLRKVEIVFSALIPMFVIFLIDIALFLKYISDRCFHRDEGVSASRSVRMSTRVSLALENNSVDLSSENAMATRTCIVAGLLYIGLMLPSVYIRSQMQFGERRGPFPTPREAELMKLFEQIVRFNAIYKFFLYVLLLKSFRRALKLLFTRCCRPKRSKKSKRQYVSCCSKEKAHSSDDGNEYV